MLQIADGNYTLIDASMEICIIFLGAFVLGMLFAWVIKPNSGVALESKETKKPRKKKDDLKIIEGIGPKIEELLHAHGVKSFQDILKTDVLGLEEVLEKGGAKFKRHNPSTWPDQASLASQEKWTELEEYQEILNGKK